MKFKDYPCKEDSVLSGTQNTVHKAAGLFLEDFISGKLGNFPVVTGDLTGWWDNVGIWKL